MAAKKRPKSQKSDNSHSTEPKFPYSITPNALRTFLKLVPNKPRPPKVNQALLKSWGLSDTNATSIIRVLKAVDLVGSANEPTDNYTAFMQPATGPAVLGRLIREVYSPLFNTSLEPYRETDTEIRRLFNIHSGGSDTVLRYQIQTFKTLCEFATFDSGESTTIVPAAPTTGSPSPALTSAVGGLSVHVDLHIHLPENKTSREYQAIIEDIARYIYRYEDVSNV